ncbi:hypothetical protein P8452_45625 [Trifolium repens]|nr:hypothetical protein P8452_45625 [Trifolium repens]
MGDLEKLIYGCPILEDLKTAYIDARVGVRARGYSKPLSKLIKANIRLFEVPLRVVSYVKFLTVTGMGKSLHNENINSYYKGYPVFEDLIELRLFWVIDIHDWDDVVKMLQNCPKLQALLISKWMRGKDDWKYPYHVPKFPLRAVSHVKFLTVTGMGKSLRNENINSYYKGYPVFEDLIELRLFWVIDIHDWDDVVKMLQNCPKLQALLISKAIVRWKVIFDLQNIFCRMRDFYKL